MPRMKVYHQVSIDEYLSMPVVVSGGCLVCSAELLSDGVHCVWGHRQCMKSKKKGGDNDVKVFLEQGAGSRSG